MVVSRCDIAMRIVASDTVKFVLTLEEASTPCQGCAWKASGRWILRCYVALAWAMAFAQIATTGKPEVSRGSIMAWSGKPDSIAWMWFWPGPWHFSQATPWSDEAGPDARNDSLRTGDVAVQAAAHGVCIEGFSQVERGLVGMTDMTRGHVPLKTSPTAVSRQAKLECCIFVVSAHERQATIS